MIRLYVPDKLDEAAAIGLSPEQAHYLRDVMRRGVGDEVALFNGRDGEWLGAVSAIDRKAASVSLKNRTRAQEVGPDLELVVALVKRARLETIIEKATELGAARIRLTLTRFTQSDRTNIARLAAIAVEAAEQTGRLDVPELVGPERLDAILDAWPEGRRLIFCDEGGEAGSALSVLLPLREKVAPKGSDEGSHRPLRQVPPPPGDLSATPHPLASPTPSPARGEGTSILIGPEGGFSPEERARLRALSFVTPVSLGPRILRADTAAIAALSLWQATLGDWAP